MLQTHSLPSGVELALDLDSTETGIQFSIWETTHEFLLVLLQTHFVDFNDAAQVIILSPAALKFLEAQCTSNGSRRMHIATISIASHTICLGGLIWPLILAVLKLEYTFRTGKLNMSFYWFCCRPSLLISMAQKLPFFTCRTQILGSSVHLEWLTKNAHCACHAPP